MKRKELEPILGVQILFLCGITLGYHSGNIDSVSAKKYLLVIAGFIANILASQVFEVVCISVGTAINSEKNLLWLKLKQKYKLSLCVLLLTIAGPLYYGHSLLKEEYLMLWIACAGVRYLEWKSEPANITYGEALACSFAEGFLFQVIPPGGEWRIRIVTSYHGLEAAIAEAEASRRVLFPLRRLLVVFPRSLYCPRSLDAFNNDRLPRLEPCASLPEIHRDVAGVCGRVYRNTVYKIRRHADDPRPAHVVTATPINTLHMVLQKRAVYTPMASADAEEIAAAFCATLPMIIRNSAELRNKCDLVYFDDTNPNCNLAETLLAKIREIEPNYDNISRDW